MEQFFKDLDRRLEVAREDDRERYRRFFDHVKPSLEAVRKRERELDKQTAHRFNVLDYLRTDELGLSRIIADLLDPEASHGQGSLFLQGLLEHFHKELAGSALEPAKAQVFVEYEIANQRRIDIVVRIPGANGNVSCLAIENKPYAGDQESQVKDYLDYLRQEYAGRFLLIYLSPTGEGPSEWSLPRREIESWRGRLVVMPYHERLGGDTSADGYGELRAQTSLSNWLAACREICQVEKLRWFLEDAEMFCRKTFGGHDMTTNSEARAVREYLLSEPQQLMTAKAVFDCWPDVVAEVSRGFLEMLQSKIEGSLRDRLESPTQSFEVRCNYGGGHGSGSWLSVFGSSWKAYESGEVKWGSGGRATIVLECQKNGPADWWYSFKFPLQESELANDDERRRYIATRKIGQAWSKFGSRGWAWVDSRFKDWAALLPELARERREGGGDITDYYVRTIVEFAVHAVPEIDKIENASESMN